MAPTWKLWSKPLEPGVPVPSMPPPPTPEVDRTVETDTADWSRDVDSGDWVITMRTTDGRRVPVMKTVQCKQDFAKKLVEAATRGILRKTVAKENEVAIPYIGYSNATLEKLPAMVAGETITCPHCWKTHDVQGTGDTFFYKCKDNTYLAGVAGKNVVGVKPDVSGSA